jgi:hypothetical protein
MSHHDEYCQWPFLTREEFELAGAFFDQRYVRAKLGPTRQIFKIRSGWTATTGSSYIEIVRLLKLPEDDDDLALALEKLSGGGDLVLKSGMDIVMVDEDADQVSDRLYYGRRSHRKTILQRFEPFQLTQRKGGASSAYRQSTSWRRCASPIQSLLSPAICDLRNPLASNLQSAYIVVHLT